MISALIICAINKLTRRVRRTKLDYFSPYRIKHENVYFLPARNKPLFIQIQCYVYNNNYCYYIAIQFLSDPVDQPRCIKLRTTQSRIIQALSKLPRPAVIHCNNVQYCPIHFLYILQITDNKVYKTYEILYRSTF